MTEILWHGRGGQGAFTAARILGAAWCLKDHHSYALSFPSFGPERRGAPMRAFTKLDHRPIGNRSEIIRADFVVYLDDTLFTEDSFSELKEGGRLLLNTGRPIRDPRVVAVDADGTALRILGRPIANTVMLGALCPLLDGLDLANLENAVRLYMDAGIREKNLTAVRAAAALTEGRSWI